MLADHTSRHKDVLLFTFVFSVLTRLLFIYGVRASFSFLPSAYTWGKLVSQ